MKLLSLFTWLSVLALARPDTFADPELVDDLLVKYNTAYSEDLKDVPPPMLREALKNALPKMQKQLVDFSVKMYASGRGAEGVKPNPLLVGFSMGMKRWSEYLSKFVPLLSQLASESFNKPKNDSRCLFDDDVCYEDSSLADSHPCCDPDVSCPLSFI